MFLQKIQKTKQFVSPKSKKGSGVSSILIILFPFTLSSREIKARPLWRLAPKLVEFLICPNQRKFGLTNYNVVLSDGQKVVGIF